MWKLPCSGLLKSSKLDASSGIEDGFSVNRVQMANLREQSWILLTIQLDATLTFQQVAKHQKKGASDH